MYQPKPKDLSGIELPEELLQLTEVIAAHVHDVWAAARISEGWSHGEQRDDAGKQTPCLVPYEELPESEKAYDRRTAMNTLKLITSMGYKITRE